MKIIMFSVHQGELEAINAYEKRNNLSISQVNELLNENSVDLVKGYDVLCIQQSNAVDKEIIYTSSNIEANNLAILGLIEKHTNKDISIVADKYFSYILDNVDIKITYFNSIEEIDDLISSNTILVCVRDIDYVKNNNYSYLVLGDLTDNFNFDVDLNKFDFISLSSFTFDSKLDIGCLIKNKNIVIEPLLHGGNSTTIYRSGTPALPFIVSFAKSIKLSIEKHD